MKVARAYAKANAARRHYPKWRFLVLEHAFHGRTFGPFPPHTRKNIALPFEPVVPGIEFVKFNDVG